jgi:hypothetical protein
LANSADGSEGFAAATMDAAIFAKNGSILPPLDYRRGGKSKAGVAELAGCFSRKGAAPPGWEGSDLDYVRPVLRQGSPFAVRVCQPWQEDCCLAKRAERGAERCHSLDYPTRQLAAPRPNTHGRNWLWALRRDQTTGRCCRVNGEACLCVGQFFDRIGIV